MGLLDILNSIQGGGASSDPRARKAIVALAVALEGVAGSPRGLRGEEPASGRRAADPAGSTAPARRRWDQCRTIDGSRRNAWW